MTRWITPGAFIGIAVVLRLSTPNEDISREALAIVQVISIWVLMLSVQIALLKDAS